jgi:DNA-cytosine methyltransferase
LIILSCFDGMSCGQIALERAGIHIDKYYSSEINKYAIAVTQKNYPDTIQIGSITEWKTWDIEQPDLIIGGSPCQGFSFAGKQLNFEDERSKLFFVFVDILKYYKPKYFLLENVIMAKEHNDVISEILGELYPESVTQPELFRTGRLEPIQINSALVSAQNRNRLYWTNIPGVHSPKDKGILLKDIIDNAKADREKSYCLDANYYKGCSKEYSDLKSRRQMVQKDNFIITHSLQPRNGKGQGGKGHLQKVDGKSYCLDTRNNQAIETLCVQIGKADLNGHDYVKRVYSPDGKSPALCTGTGGNHEPKISQNEITWRKLTPLECERLQTVPDNYTEKGIDITSISNSQRYKMLGNGWTVDVIAHIFSYI